MNVKRFVARNVREALQEVRYSFGNDAIILSNKTVPGGVEIIAVPAEQMLAEASKREQDRLDRERREQEQRRVDEQARERDRLQRLQEEKNREQEQAFERLRARKRAEQQNQPPVAETPSPNASWTKMQFASEDYSVNITSSFKPEEENKPSTSFVEEDNLSLSEKIKQAKEVLRTSTSKDEEEHKPAPGTKTAAVAAYSSNKTDEPSYDAPAQEKEQEQEAPIEMTQARTLQERASALKKALEQSNAYNPSEHPEDQTETNPSFAVAPEEAKVKPYEVPDTPKVTKNVDAPQQRELAQHVYDREAEKTETAIPGAVMNEIRDLRKVVEEHLSGLAWGEAARSQPVKADLLRHMLDLGFSPKLCRDMLQDLPMEMDVATATAWIKGSTDRAFFAINAEDDIVDIGGVYALVGPTGVGKTTTTAKLAARCVLKHGPNKMALITTDSYRIGAHEQLKIYGRILGVQVHSVKDEKELQSKLKELSSKHLILIDTMGMSQNDKNVTPLISMLDTCDVQRLLLLPATSRGETLDDIIKSYAKFGLSGCILTKIDESTGLGTIVDALMRHGLLLHYVCNGQRVPEDIHLPNKTYLIHRAFKEVPEDSAHKLSTEESAMIMANSRILPSPPKNFSLS